MDNYQGPIDFSELKKNMTAINDTDKEVLAQMARLVNEITRRRKVLGLTQAEVAKRAGITQAQVARLESSHTVPSMETVMKVAFALGLLEEAAASQYVHA